MSSRLQRDSVLRALWLALLLACTCLSGAAVGQDDDEDGAEGAMVEQDYSRNGADTCYRCHDEDSEFPVLDIFRTAHGAPTDQRGPFGSEQLQCEACHGPGEAHSKRVRRGQERPKMLNFGAAEITPSERQNEVCSGCHEKALAGGWHGGSHESDGLVCADCHQVHVTHDPVMDDNREAEVCFNCHKQQRADSFKASTHPIRFGQMTCSGCHAPHDSDTEGSLIGNNLNETCYECHAEKRGPFIWEHAPVPEDCSLCHNAHGSNHPALLTRRAPLLCQQCHAQDGHPSVAHTASGLSRPGGSSFLQVGSCANCHTQVHGSNHPSGTRMTR